MNRIEQNKKEFQEYLSLYNASDYRKRMHSIYSKAGRKRIDSIFTNNVPFFVLTKEDGLAQARDMLSEFSKKKNFPECNVYTDDYMGKHLPNELSSNEVFQGIFPELYLTKIQRVLGGGELVLASTHGSTCKPPKHKDMADKAGVVVEQKDKGGSIKNFDKPSRWAIHDELNEKYYSKIGKEIDGYSGMHYDIQPTHQCWKPINKNDEKNYILDHNVPRAMEYITSLWPGLEGLDGVVEHLTDVWNATNSLPLDEKAKIRKEELSYPIFLYYTKGNPISLTEFTEDGKMRWLYIARPEDKEFVLKHVSFKVPTTRGGSTEARADGVITLEIKSHEDIIDDTEKNND